MIELSEEERKRWVGLGEHAKYIAVCPKCSGVRISADKEPKRIISDDVAKMFCGKDNTPVEEYVIFKRIGKIKVKKRKSKKSQSYNPMIQCENFSMRENDKR